MKNYISIFSIVCICCAIAFFSGCKKDEQAATPGLQGPPGPALKGNFTGHVTLFDQYGTKLFTNLNKVKVSIDGTSANTVTDSTGKFSINNINTGTYTLTYLDSSFGAFKAEDIQLVGGGDNIRDAKLYQVPAFNVSAVTAVDTNSNANVKIRGTILPDPKPRTLIIFVGNSASNSADPATYQLVYSKNIPANAATFNLLIASYELNSALLTTGKTAYFSVYGQATGSSTYEDLPTGRTTYTAISATAVNVSHVMP